MNHRHIVCDSIETIRCQNLETSQIQDAVEPASLELNVSFRGSFKELTCGRMKSKRFADCDVSSGCRSVYSNASSTEAATMSTVLTCSWFRLPTADLSTVHSTDLGCYSDTHGPVYRKTSLSVAKSELEYCSHASTVLFPSSLRYACRGLDCCSGTSPVLPMINL